MTATVSAQPRSKPAPEAVAAALAAACQLVAGIAVGGSFRLPIDVGPAVRFTPSPVAAIVMGAFAAVATFIGFHVAASARRSHLGAALLVVVGALLAVGNGVISITLVSVTRSQYDFATALERTKQAIGAAYYMIPPGLFWSPTALALLLATVAARPRPEHERLARALAFGGVALAATAEVSALVFRGRTMTTVTVVIAAAGAVAALVGGTRRAAAASGVPAARALLGRAIGALAAAQAWVLAIYLYWRG